jgi:hypothetical protein
MTGSQLLQLLRDELKMDYADLIWKQDEKLRFINTALHKIQSDGLYNWGENDDLAIISTTAGQEEYDLPVGCVRINQIILDDSRYKLRYTTKGNVLRRNVNTGKPSEYYLFQNKIGLFPTPDGAYSLKCLYQKLLPSIGLTDEFPLSDEFIQPLIKYSAYLAWSTPRGNQGEAEYKLQDYNRSLNGLIFRNQLQSMDDLIFAQQRGQGYTSDKSID